MERTTRRQKRASESETPSFQNRLYRAEVGRTPAGSPVLNIAPANPTGRFAHHRLMAAFVYELAAEMERRCEAIGARWAVSPDATNARIVLELARDDESAEADAFVASLIADQDLG